MGRPGPLQPRLDLQPGRQRQHCVRGDVHVGVQPLAVVRHHLHRSDGQHQLHHLVAFGVDGKHHRGHCSSRTPGRRRPGPMMIKECTHAVMNKIADCCCYPTIQSLHEFHAQATQPRHVPEPALKPQDDQYHGSAFQGNGVYEQPLDPTWLR